MFPIASSTIATTGGFTDFNNIPQSFTHLQIRVSGVSAYTPGSGPIETWVGLNNQAAVVPTAGYTHRLFTDGSSATGNSGAQGGLLSTPWLPYGISNTGGSYIVDVLDYTNTNKFKVIRAFGGYDANGSGLVSLHSGYSNITAAVVQIRVATNSGNFAIGARIDLYGISTSPATGA